MRLKSVEINGFKSFADRTKLRFDDRICGVVGPNGCGKSNVVDAIRWAMGEQSAKQMRGRAMEDVIFAGTQARKPVGMAEVTLVFENEDGRAPAQYKQFSEISVSRRLFRSGESDYLINKKVVRLKDVVELFLGTGVGRRAYSIIEQGQIGLIINSKPEERRVLIEEAAGITKYKAKKDEALRKVKSTQDDLVRVTDKIIEIKRTLNSLNRAAKKAERYKRYKGELRAIDLVLGALDFKELISRAQEVEKNLAEVNERRERLQGIVAESETDRERMQLELLAKEKAVQAARQTLHDLENGIRDVESRIALLQRDIENAGIRKAQYSAEIENYNQRLAQTRQELEQAADKVSEFEARMAEEQADLTEKSEVYATVKGRHEELSEQIGVEKNELVDVLTEIASSRKTIDSLKERSEEIGYRRNRASEQVASLSSRVETMAADHERMTENFRVFDEEFKQMVSKRAERAEHLKELKEDNLRKKEAYESLRNQMHGKSVRLKSLNEMVKGLEGFDKGVRHLLLEEGEGQAVPGLHGVIADYIATEPKFETALEAVLGDRLQTIVVEGQSHGVNAIHHLKNGSEGRGSFMPMVQTQPAPYSFPEHTLQAAISPMTDVVQVNETYAPVVSQLLSDVLIVEDLDQAVEIYNANGYQGSLVTLDGEVIENGGLMTGGSQESIRKGILHKRREVRELEAEVAVLTEKYNQAENAYMKGEGLVSAFERRIEVMDTEIREREMEIVGRKSSLERMAEEIQRSKKEIERLLEEESTYVREEEQRAAAEAEASARMEELVAKRNGLSEEVSTREEEVRALAGQRDELQRLVTEARIGITSYREKVEGLKQTSAQMEKAIEQMEGMINRRQSEIVAADEDSESLRVKIAECREDLEQRIQSRDEHKLEVDRVVDTYNEFMETIREREKALREMRGNQEELRETRHKEELNLQEVSMKCEHLTDEIQQRYGLDLEERCEEFLEGRLPQEEIQQVEGEEVQPETEQETEELPPSLDPRNEDFDRESLNGRQRFLREKIESMGEINPNAIEEFHEQKERYEFFTTQRDDLEKAIIKLKQAIARINQTSRTRFNEVFQIVNEKFQKIVPDLFIGGKGMLRLVGEGDILEQGLDVVIRPRGKKLQSISLLSGGEKALAAISLIFAIFLHKPTPFALLDEVDAPLDDQNINRFASMVASMAERSQFILITHNKETMQIANTLYGITMQEPGVSKLVSVRFDEAEEVASA